MPRYYVRWGEPPVVEAADPLAALIATDAWRHSGWAAEFKKDPTGVRNRAATSILPVVELGDEDKSVNEHAVGFLTLMTALGHAKRNLEDY